MHKEKKNYFISVEGVEGVGKSTAIAFLRDYLSERNISLVVTREPGGTPVAESIRRVLLEQHAEVICPYAELLLMFAGRAQNIQHVIAPALAAGQWVLSDRFTDASFAYQGGGRGIPISHIALLEEWIQQGLQPDITILLDAPVQQGLKRIETRGVKDRIELENIAFFERVRQVYRDRARLYPDRFVIINALQDVASVQADLKCCLERIVVFS